VPGLVVLRRCRAPTLWTRTDWIGRVGRLWPRPQTSPSFQLHRSSADGSLGCHEVEGWQATHQHTRLGQDSGWLRPGRVPSKTPPAYDNWGEGHIGSLRIGSLVDWTSRHARAQLV
jgi:hypothetical protein